MKFCSHAYLTKSNSKWMSQEIQKYHIWEIDLILGSGVRGTHFFTSCSLGCGETHLFPEWAVKATIDVHSRSWFIAVILSCVDSTVTLPHITKRVMTKGHSSSQTAGRNVCGYCWVTCSSFQETDISIEYFSFILSTVSCTSRQPSACVTLERWLKIIIYRHPNSFSDITHTYTHTHIYTHAWWKYFEGESASTWP